MVRQREIDGTIKPSVPYIELGGANCPNAIISGWNPLAFFRTFFCTPDFEYREDADTGYIYVYTTGIYLIDWSMCFYGDPNAGPAVVKVTPVILINDIGILGGAAFITCTNYDYVQVCVSKTVYLKAGDLVTCGFWSDATATYLFIPDYLGEGEAIYSHFRISYVPMGGWNNNTGGNIINRGVKR
jgi:hypothetical protein